ncbi:OVARIAN TUMOR DOMAIN-containing deubiquitinating enzyme [Salix suchowensis]|nr:OVARIAN TUMOR DOMAIN-containing deubiquitinating enzyme [Salix suchowensis]
MIVYEQDPDVVRWGLHNLLMFVHFQILVHVILLLVMAWIHLTLSMLENIIMIRYMQVIRTFKDCDVEASGLNNSEQESIITQHWPGPHETYHDSENSLNMEELDVILNIASESALDGEVGKRINEMVPVPHVPKTNGEIPSEDEQMSDHQRLLERLKVYYLVENKVQGDGNCQFSSLSDQLYHSPEHHKLVREQVIDQLKSQPQLYNGYVSMAYGDYLKKMSKSGEWGDHVTLQAAADSYGIKIFMITSFRDTCYIEILPNVPKSNRVIFLSFWAEVHYNSIYPEGEVPQYEPKKKKCWWNLR